MHKLFLTLMAVFSLVLTIYSQNQPLTAYQKKCNELTANLLRKVGVSKERIDNKDITEVEMLVVMAKLGNTVDGVVLLSQYNKDMEQAKKLKTEVDFAREKAQKAAQEKREKEALLKQKELEEKAKNAERIANRDRIKIIEEVKESVSEWYKRGEFEKATDYQKRLDTATYQKISSEFYKQVNDKILQITQYKTISIGFDKVG